MEIILTIKTVWINLPVKDLAKSRSFFRAIGLRENLMFQNSNEAGSFYIGENDFVLMLFPYEAFRGFTQNQVADASEASEVLVSFDAQSRGEVDELASLVREAGGKVFAGPAEVQGYMYGFGFADLDGHRWNMVYMDRDKMSR